MTKSIRPLLSAIALGLLYILLIPFAAWLVKHYGPVDVGPGLKAPAAVFVIGAILVVRDLLQDQLRAVRRGRFAFAIIVALIAVGTLLAIAVDPMFGIASGVAFALSETIDLLVYTPLRKAGQYGAVLVSNAVSIIVDSVVFLWLAFGSLEFLYGQIYGKALMTFVALGVLAVIHERRARKRDLPFNVVSA